jgi:hypothetical protein
MAEAARESKQDYWRPAKGSLYIAKSVLPERLCPHCGTSFAIGAEFCHVCGIEREDPSGSRHPHSEMDWLAALNKLTGLGTVSLTLLALACICVIAATLVGSVYRPDNFLMWQAVHDWRSEWLLVSVVFLLAGVLLKK